jgi:hypothetical protein
MLLEWRLKVNWLSSVIPKYLYESTQARVKEASLRGTRGAGGVRRREKMTTLDLVGEKDIRQNAAHEVNVSRDRCMDLRRSGRGRLMASNLGSRATSSAKVKVSERESWRSVRSLM